MAKKRTNNDQQNIIHSKLKIEIEILLKVAWISVDLTKNVLEGGRGRIQISRKSKQFLLH
jgi:hypothetical protein